MEKSSSAEESFCAFVMQKTKSELVSWSGPSSSGTVFFGSCENEMRGLIPGPDLSEEHIFIAMGWWERERKCRTMRSFETIGLGKEEE